MAGLRSLFAALALAATLPPTLASAQPLASAPASDPQADRLIAMILGDDALLRAGGQAFDTGLDRKIAEDKTLAALFARDPGFKPYVASRVRNSLIARMRQALPTLRAQLSAILVADMTATDIADTITFFSSAVGKKMLARIYQSAAENAGDTEATKDAALRAIMRDLTPEDFPALIAFGASPAAQKLNAVNPKLAATAKAWTEKFLADNEAPLTQEAMVATAAYLAAHK